MAYEGLRCIYYRVSCPDGTKFYSELSLLGRQRFLKAVSPWLLKQGNVSDLHLMGLNPQAKFVPIDEQTDDKIMHLN
jgi:hypothetical protein